MNKRSVDALLSHMKAGGVDIKAMPWAIEGFTTTTKFGEKVDDKVRNVRYVGFKPYGDWTEILSANNNLMLKFIIGRSEAKVEFYIANKAPFLRFYWTPFTDSVKWEVLLGTVKTKLKHDKEAVIHHKETTGNLYALIKPQLKP